MNGNSVLDAVGVPAGWRFPLITGGAIVVLAGLDLLGAVLAKEWADRHHAAWFLAGFATFGVLFAIYAASLRVAELTVVTFGWIIVLQVGLLLIERFRYGVTLSPAKWLAIGLIIALEAFLILAPNGGADGRS